MEYNRGDTVFVLCTQGVGVGGWCGCGCVQGNSVGVLLCESKELGDSS